MGKIRHRLKLLRMRFARQPSYWAFMPRGGNFDYAGKVGDGTNSSVVMAPLLWVCRTFPEAPLQVLRRRSDGQLDPITPHAMVELIRRPNPHYSGVVLWMATMLDFYAGGNAYWVKVRSREDRPVELWWVPRWMIEPVAPEGEGFIDHYLYRYGAEEVKLPPEDVVHFRFGLDPQDPRMGLSPLASVLREVFTDDEAERFTASLLQNMGVPGLVISPTDTAFKPNPEDMEAVKARVMDSFTGERRGEPIVMSMATEIAQFGFSPEQMDLTALRHIPEERVSAVLGVPAIVAGLGAGLDRSTFTNFGEAREMAYESNIIPTQRLVVEDLRNQLLPDFESKPERREVAFDLTQVRVLQEDELKKAQRLNTQLQSGGIMVSEYRRALNLPVLPEHEVFLRPVNLVAVKADGSPAVAPPEPAPAPAPPPAENGNGNLEPDQARELVAAATGNGGSNP